MEIRDNIVSIKKLIYADELEIGECFRYNNHIYLKTKIALPIMSSVITYVDLTADTIYPGDAFKNIYVEPVKAYVQIESVKS